MRTRLAAMAITVTLASALLFATPAASAETHRASGKLDFGPTLYGQYFWYDVKMKAAEKNDRDHGSLHFWTSAGDDYRYELASVVIEGDRAYAYGPMTSTNTGMGERWTYVVVWDRGEPSRTLSSQFVPDLLFEQQVVSEAEARSMLEQRYIPHWLLASGGDIRLR